MRRRAILNPVDDVWTNVTYLSILDTDWVIRTLRSHTSLSLWEEMFNRHQREREALLKWENKQEPKQIYKSSSTETLRLSKEDAQPEMMDSDGSSKSDEKGKQAETSTRSNYYSSFNEASSPPSGSSGRSRSAWWRPPSFEETSEAASIDTMIRDTREGRWTASRRDINPFASDFESDAESDAGYVSSATGSSAELIEKPPSSRASSIGESDWDVVDP